MFITRYLTDSCIVTKYGKTCIEAQRSLIVARMTIAMHATWFLHHSLTTWGTCECDELMLILNTTWQE